MRKGIRDLTTGDVAQRMRISQQMVIRLIDSGVLPGYRLPNSSFRRVREEDAKQFAQAHGMSWDDPETTEVKT